MSNYEKINWKNSPETEITAEALNHMDDGIKEAHELIDSFGRKENLVLKSEEVKTKDTYFGKPVYTKTIRYTTTITAGQPNDVPHGINNIDTVWIDLSNSYLTNASFVFPVTIGYYMSGFDNVCPYVNKTNIYFASQGTWGVGWTKVITLRYTKTTD